MARGGTRPGAGRKKGSLGRRTIGRQLIRDQAIKLDITPLEVMLTTMRQHWLEGRLSDACTVARDAAPYVHRKLASMSADVRVRDPFEAWTTEEMTQALNAMRTMIARGGDES